jgi:hypothetical protein
VHETGSPSSAGGLARTVAEVAGGAPSLLLDLRALEEGQPEGWETIEGQLSALRRSGLPVGVVGGPLA